MLSQTVPSIGIADIRKREIFSLSCGQRLILKNTNISVRKAAQPLYRVFGKWEKGKNSTHSLLQHSPSDSCGVFPPKLIL